MKACIFCGETESESNVIGGDAVVCFAEHYNFCTECSAIWTYMVIWKAPCGHFVIEDSSPVVIREPWFGNWLYKYKGSPLVLNDRCSKCGMEVTADGW